MVPPFFCGYNLIFRNQRIHAFFTGHANCTVHWTVQLAWTVYIDTLYTIIALSEQCNYMNIFFLVCYFFNSFSFIKKTSYTRAVMWTYLFSRKTSIEWIKFTRTVISILYLIIFYLILLHAQIIMKTVFFIGWIL
jgi:hypothetical protein